MKLFFYTSILAIAISASSCGDSFEDNASKNTADSLTTADENAKKQLKIIAKSPNSGNISLAAAQVLIDNYANNGDETHFKHGESRITGFYFTRRELQEVLNQGASDSLFLMWCLDTSYTDNNKLFLNVIIAALDDKTINTNILLKSNQVPSNNFISSTNKKIKESPIPVPQVSQYLSDFINTGKTDHLYSEDNKKGVKLQGFTVNLADIKTIDIFEENSSPNDLFVLVPVIAPGANFPTGDFKGRDHLSLAFGRVDTSYQYIPKFVEYHNPCPSYCPKNIDVMKADD